MYEILYTVQLYSDIPTVARWQANIPSHTSPLYTLQRGHGQARVRAAAAAAQAEPRRRIDVARDADSVAQDLCEPGRDHSAER